MGCEANDAKVAIEVKISQVVHKQDLKGLIAFCEAHKLQAAIVVSQDARPRRLEINEDTQINILPWQVFLEKLWQGSLIYGFFVYAHDPRHVLRCR